MWHNAKKQKQIEITQGASVLLALSGPGRVSLLSYKVATDTVTPGAFSFAEPSQKTYYQMQEMNHFASNLFKGLRASVNFGCT